MEQGAKEAVILKSKIHNQVMCHGMLRKLIFSAGSFVLAISDAKKGMLFIDQESV